MKIKTSIIDDNSSLRIQNRGKVMNRKTSISGYQFFCMVFLFEIGSTSLVGITHVAKQDVWISMIISMLIGCVLFYVHIKLYEIYPEYQLTKYVQFIFGKYVGKSLAIMYIVFFIYIAGRILRDIEDLLTMTLFTASSLISIGIILLFAVMYGLFKGIETFARSTEFIFIFMIIFIFLTLGFEFISNIFQINNLRPVLEQGWEPVIKAVFPFGILFPFGEIIVFTMILPYLNKKEKAYKVGLPAMLFSGFILVIFTLSSLAILGASAISKSEYPILVAAGMINIADFIQRIDTFIILLIVCGGFIKLSIYSFCAISGAADLFNVKSSSQLIYPICVIILITSLLMASNHDEHRNEGFGKVPYLIHIPLHFIIPISLLIFSLTQKKLREKK